MAAQQPGIVALKKMFSSFAQPGDVMDKTRAIICPAVPLEDLQKIDAALQTATTLDEGIFKLATSGVNVQKLIMGFSEFTAEPHDCTDSRSVTPEPH